MKYAIRRKMIDEKHQVVFLLSVVETLTGTAAIWSTHRYEGSPTTPVKELAAEFQQSHDKQIDKIILQEYLSEPDEYKITTVEDLTQFG